MLFVSILGSCFPFLQSSHYPSIYLLLRDHATWIIRLSNALLLSLAFQAPGVLVAQFSLSVGAGIGGGLTEPRPVEPRFQLDEYTSTQVATRAFQESLDLGLQTRARLAYHFNHFIKADLDLAFISGFTQSSSLDSAGQLDFLSSVKAQRLQISPGVVISLGERRFSPFLRLGIVMPYRYRINYESHELKNAGMLAQTLQARATASLGINPSIGLSYRISHRVRIFYEVAYLYQQAFLRQAELLEYQINGQDSLTSLAPYQRENLFVKEGLTPVNHPENADFDLDRPLETHTQKVDLNLLTINLGLVFSFN